MSRSSILKSRPVWIGVIVLAVASVAAFTNRPGRTDAVQAVANAIAVEATPVTIGPLAETVSAVGTIAAMRDVVVSSETAGRVTAVAVKVGDRVHEGQPLIIVDDELKVVAVEQAKAQMLAAQTSLKKAQRDYQRAETLFKSGDIPDVELEGNRLAMHAAEAQEKGAAAGLRAAERQLADTRVKSPINGLVASRKVEIGEMLSPGREVANIIDVSTVKVRLSIAEEEIGLISLNQAATLRIDSRPGEVYGASVYTIGSKTETTTGHTYPVEVVIRNRNAFELKAGMFGRVDIMTSSAPEAMSISRESLVSDESAPAVFIVEDHVARLRHVKLGLRTADRFQVLEGLKAGDLVVSFGQKGLKDGAAVQYK
jgi:RND family efflux transporter MFP subunit